MQAAYTYVCPNRAKECSVDASIAGQNVLCPHCSQEFFATPAEVAPAPASPDDPHQVVIPAKVPFFRWGKNKIMDERLNGLVEDGEMSDADEQTLTRTALALGLTKEDFQKLVKKHFWAAFEPIKKRIEKAFVVTDDDLAEIESLKKKYGVGALTLTGTFDLFRTIYLIEEKGVMPPAIPSELMLDRGEDVYYATQTAWAQVRKVRDGYSGMSVSVPTGIKGVRFRFGHYTPRSHDEIKPLAHGTLSVTSKRLLFRGDTRSTRVDFRKIIDSEIFLDCLRIDKATSKADYFTMNPAEARYVTALIGTLR